MNAFCTYCSASKSKEPGRIPAIQRYRSPRIDRVHAAAQQLRLPFLILSGEYGLIPADLPIATYDHLLTPDEVPVLAEVVAEQMREQQLTSIVYFTRPLVGNSTLLSYCAAFLMACSLASVGYLVLEVEGKTQDAVASTHERLRDTRGESTHQGVRGTSGTSPWHQVAAAARAAKQTLIADRVRGEREFEQLLAQHPRDGMIYFKRGEAYEEITEDALAASDFERAKELFPLREWKDRAEEGLRRVRRR